MPFRSKKQNAWGHTPEGMEALGGAQNVKEWEGETEYNNLPTTAPKKKKKFSFAPTRVRAGYTDAQRAA